MRLAELQMLFIYILMCLLFHECSSFLDYIWPNIQDKKSKNTDVELKIVPFELDKRDENFLQYANELIGLKTSELDKCHSRVIYTLTKSCHTLNSEELGKLAVMLLNCQSAIEGREIYPCTENMSLKECTQNMNANTWNAYHLVTNRAKAVCYRIRQEQFQGLTEITVNKLMNSAQVQINMMHDISQNQQHLNDQTLQALNTVQNCNNELLEQQRILIEGQTKSRAAVDANIRALLNEKALIKTGQAEVMAIIKKLLKQIEMASMQLDSQTQQRAKNHQEVLNDLHQIHENAEDIWLKIEQSSSYLSEQNAYVLGLYDQTLNQLTHINATINFLGTILNQTRSEIDEKLYWLNNTLIGTGYTMDMVVVGLSYVLYISSLMIICAFLNLSITSRMFILTITIFNLILENMGNSAIIKPMNLKLLTIVIVCVLIGRLLVKKLLRRLAGKSLSHSEILYSDAKKVDNTLIGDSNGNYTERSHINSHELDEFIRECSVETNSSSRLNNLNSMLSASEYTPPVSRADESSLRFRSYTPSNISVDRKLCEARTLKGTYCKNSVVSGRSFCMRHQTGHQK